MKKFTWLYMGLCLLFGSVGAADAQEMADGVTPPPKVLVIQREMLKPGKSGSLHQKTESAFVQAGAEEAPGDHSGEEEDRVMLGLDLEDLGEDEREDGHHLRVALGLRAVPDR